MIKYMATKLAMTAGQRPMPPLGAGASPPFWAKSRGPMFANTSSKEVTSEKPKTIETTYHKAKRRKGQGCRKMLTKKYATICLMRSDPRPGGSPTCYVCPD
jgi:hypothetical protein